MDKLIRNIPKELNDSFKDALEKQSHLGSGNDFVIACMRALVDAADKNAVVPAPVELVTKAESKGRKR